MLILPQECCRSRIVTICVGSSGQP
jgi:hypothetical protein